MTLPSSGYMSLDMVRVEFGNVAPPVYLSQYYAGGGRVPAGVSGSNGPIPSSGYLSLWHFYGSSNWRANVSVGVANIPANGWGYSKSGDYSTTWGSCTPNSSPGLCGGAMIVALFWDGGVGLINVAIDGNQPNSNASFTTVDINGTIFNRASAVAYYDPPQTGGRYSQWVFSSAGNPFGTGGNVTVIFR